MPHFFSAAGLRIAMGCVLATLLSLAAVNDCAAAHYDVYLLAGQSNMDGRGLVSELPETQKKPVDEAIIFYRNLSGSSDGWETLAPGFSLPPKYKGEFPSPTFGPEIGFARSMLEDQPDRKLALIKGSKGGTSLRADWKPGVKGDSSSQGPCYRHFIETVQTASEQLAKRGDQFTIRGLLWHQGESDSKASAAVYRQRLEELIDRIREDIGVPHLPVAVGEVFDNGNRDGVRAAIQEAAAASPFVGLVTSTGTTTWDPGTHFDAQSQLLLGKRFAKAIRQLPETESAGTRFSAETLQKVRPNVLFIAVDDLRPTIGCYGDEHAITPNIDKLADRGVRFDRAYCQVAVCNPSRASLMTGLRPDTLGVWTLPIHFREAKPDAVTLPQWLRKAGYTAVSHGKIYHNPTPDPQSWSEPIRDNPALPPVYPDGTRDRIRDEMAKLPAKDWRKNNLRGPATASPDLPDDQLIDGARTEMCIEDLRRLGKSEQPFFLAMGFIRPHLAFVAPKKYWDLYDPNALPVPGDERSPEGAPPYSLHNNSEFAHYVDLMNMPRPWDDEVLSESAARRLVHGYHACVSYIDAQIGRLLNTLDEEGLTDDTIVVLWSDHGYKLGEYRGWGKMTNYEIDTRVPLIISAPAFKETAGESTESLAELLDLYPTLCELAGIERPDFVEGESLVPSLKDTKVHVRKAAVSQYYRRHEGGEYMGYALRTDRHRYVEWRDFKTGETKALELYDHSGKRRNPLGKTETVNLAHAAEPELLRELSEMLEASHPRRELNLTPSVHTSPSGRHRFPVRLSFKNEHSAEVMVYPIQPSGRRSRGQKLASGESIDYQARIGGAYVIESKDGQLHEIHSPSWPAKTVVIGR